MNPRIGVAVSGTLLVLSAIILGLLHLPDIVESLPFQWWIHIAVLVAVGAAFWRLHKTRKAGIPHRHEYLRFPWWLVGTGVVVIALVAPIWLPSSFDLGTAPNGEPIHHSHMSENDGKYFLHLNHKYVREISRSEYLALERDFEAMFARGWIFFSYLGLMIWYYLARRNSVHAG